MGFERLGFEDLGLGGLGFSGEDSRLVALAGSFNGA